MAGSISGKVNDSSGGGMANVTVRATAASGAEGGAQATAETSRSGNYQITNLKAGEYWVAVMPNSLRFTPANQFVVITQNQNATGRNFKQKPS